MAAGEGSRSQMRHRDLKWSRTGTIWRQKCLCVTKIRRYPDQEDALLEAFSMLGALDIELLPVPFDDVVALACETPLTANDASYLWLAREIRANHLTLDHALDSAWRTR